MAWLLGLVLAMTGATPVPLACTVAGADKAGLDAQAVCARFAEVLSAASGRAYALVPSGPRRDGDMAIAIRFDGRDSVSGAATLFHGGRAHPLETRMISLSDRRLGLDSIALLARDVSRAMQRPD